MVLLYAWSTIDTCLTFGHYFSVIVCTLLFQQFSTENLYFGPCYHRTSLSEILIFSFPCWLFIVFGLFPLTLLSYCIYSLTSLKSLDSMSCYVISKSVHISSCTYLQLLLPTPHFNPSSVPLAINCIFPIKIPILWDFKQNFFMCAHLVLLPTMLH